MKKLFIIFFILKTSLIFSQNFNDKIITVKGDTIRCKVTLVNNGNILFDRKIKDNLEHKSLLLSYVKHIIIDKNNYPQLLLSGKSDTIISGAEIVLPTGNKLVVEQTKLRKNQDKPNSITFIEGKRIIIKLYNNEKKIKGKIDCIKDSSIFVKGYIININKIESLSRHRGGTILVAGLSSVAFLGGVCYIWSATWQPKYDRQGDIINDDTGYVLGIAVAMVIDFAITVPAGIIEAATTKHYRMDNGWKVYVSK